MTTGRGSAAAEPAFPPPPAPLPGDREAAAAAEAALAARLAALAPDAFGVAVSGGGDSLALFFAALKHGMRIGARIEAVTVDHGLRAEAADEARAVAALCGRLSVPHATLRWQGPAQGNLAQAARDARARLIAAWAAERGLEAVALGHTLDDQAETVLMRLGRGSGLDGLSGMREAVRREGVLWLRPALGLRRGALRAMLRVRGRGWFDDPSNEDATRDRIRARQALAALAALAPLDITPEALAETATRLAADSDHLRAEARALGRAAVSIGAAGELRLDRGALRAAAPPLRRRLLARLMRLLPDAAHPPRAAALASLEAALTGAEDAPARTLHGVILWAEGDAAVLCREAAALPPRGSLADPWDGRWRLSAPAPPPGAEAGPLGEAGLAALRAAERAEDWTPPPEWAAAPRAARLAAPAIWTGETLLAAPLAGFGEASAHDLLAGRLA